MVKQVPKPEIDTHRLNKGIGGKKGGASPKRSGTYFEHSAEDYFNTDVSKAKRVIGSGSFGVVCRDPNLLGDVNITFGVLKNKILAEAKFGYAKGESQMTIKKEWLDKIDQEARLVNKHPALICKFKGARGKNTRLIIFSWETFMKMMRELTDLVSALGYGG